MLNINFRECEKETQKIPKNIPEVSDISYSDFFKNYIFSNTPCILKKATADWKCSTQWVSDNKINYDYLLSRYGSSHVPVADCKEYDQCKKYIPLEEYINYIRGAPCESVLYLKDWHLRREHPNDDFYQVPKHFASDWLNEYSVDNNKDDYMFVYFGPKGSWTPFHADVYSSFSWSANVFGKKKWLLFPPGEEKKFLDSLGNLPNNVEHLLHEDYIYFEIIQNAGDGIFVPSGWYHQVYNLEDTISINHNWVNGCNIDIMLNSLKKNMEMVEKEIIEFKDTAGWADHCQLMLQSLFGINYDGFFNFVKYIANKRLEKYRIGNNIAFENWNLSEDHLIFDLKSLKNVLEILTTETYFNASVVAELNNLLQNISQVIENCTRKKINN